jgi:hypothetical protein
VFKEDEFTTWPQDTSDALNGLHDARNGAKRKGAHNRISAAVIQRNPLSWKVQEFDIQLGSAPLHFCEPNHPSVRFQCVELAHSCGIVAGEVDARTYTNFEDFTLSQGNDPLANFTDGLWVAQHSDEVRINVVSVEGHGCHLPSFAPTS